MNKKYIQIAIVLIIIGAVFAFSALDLQSYANLDYIKSQQTNLESYYNDNKLLVITVFGAVYVLVTALSLPAAAILTLLSGALFGLVVGTLMASFASSIGATLAFLMARFVARDYVQTKLAKPLEKFNEGFVKEGPFYLFALRLVPAFPFFVVNIVMALLPIKAFTFYWVSQLGMLAGTVVYVYAGTQLAQIDSLSDIVSPPLILAFVLLGIFPIVAKKVIALLRKENPNE